jgi:hypothetical protein
MVYVVFRLYILPCVSASVPPTPNLELSVALRVVGGDEKGSPESETVKCHMFVTW